MGDIVALVEKAQETLEAEQAERMMKRFQKGQFNMNDLKGQLEQMMKMGGMQGMMGMMPGMAKMQKQLDDAGFDDTVIKRQIALINSMTKKERANPQILQASRKKRIAAGAGQLRCSDLNKLLKMHRQMADMMKKKMMGMGGGAGMPSPEEMEKMQAELAGMDPSTLPPELREIAEGKMPQMPKGLPGLPGAGGMPGGLPGLGGKGGLPGLGGGGFKGLPGFGKKKK
jgi:signal recognition particle subunit SRP54